MSRFLFAYPSRGRPKQFRETLRLWQGKLSGKHSYRWVIVIDTDDPTMCNDQMSFWLSKAEDDNFKVIRGPHKSKIEACNAGLPVLRNTPDDYDIAILVSDDMIPIIGSYDDVIAEDMQKCFPKLDGCLHYDDGLRKAEDQDCIVLPVVGRELMDRLSNRFYHPDYLSMWKEAEFTMVVNRENRSKYIARVIIQHAWKENGTDRTYLRSEDNYKTDGETFNRRQKEDFPGAIRNTNVIKVKVA